MILIGSVIWSCPFPTSTSMSTSTILLILYFIIGSFKFFLYFSSSFFYRGYDIVQWYVCIGRDTNTNTGT
jgi:hypothetical protein